MADCNPIIYEEDPTEVILSEEEKFRLQCEAREDYYRRVGWKDEVIVDLLYTLRQMELENQQLKAETQQLYAKKQNLSSRLQYLQDLADASGISYTLDN